jgi:hypothetical protein
MAQADWDFLTGGLAVTDMDNGVTSGTGKPNGGGNFVYGFNSLATVVGTVALHTNQTNYSPMAKGGSIRAAIKRGPSAGKTGFSPFLYLCSDSSNLATADAYILGLNDADPHRIVLRKGKLTGGVPDGIVNGTGTNNILLVSSAAYEEDTWLHLRLDAILQGTGDVLLQVYANDLTANAVTSPTWVVVPGMEGTQSPSITGFVDDSLAVNTGTSPLTSGFAGFGMQTTTAGRRAYIDHVEVARQV